MSDEELERIREESTEFVDRLKDRVIEQQMDMNDLKTKIEKAIRRISVIRMDADTTKETHVALDFVLKALLGDEEDDG